MRVRIVVLTCLLLACAALGRTQGIAGSCPTCMVISYVDTPSAAGTDVIAGSGFYIGGWGFECTSGEYVTRVEVWEQGSDGYFAPLAGGVLYFGLPRPDVQRAYAPYCPTVTGFSGFQYYPAAPPAAGVHTYWITAWRGGLYQGSLRTVTIQ